MTRTPSNGDPFTVDLRATERVSEGLPAAARRLAGFCRTIVEVATAHPSGESVPTPVPCRRRPAGKPCPGRLVVLRQDIPDEARWSCPVCGDSGMVVGWRGTRGDFSTRRSERLPGEPGETVEAFLSEEEWRFLRGHVITNGSDVDRMIAGARLTARGVVLSGTLDDLDDLAGSVAFTANHTQRRKEIRICESILDRLDEALGRDVQSGPSLDSLQTALAGAIEAYNRTPQPELGGLSPEQVFRLLGSSWEGPGSAVRIEQGLPLSDLERSPLLVNARLYLDALAESGGTKATANGNLNRAFVGRMFESMRLEPLARELGSRHSKRLNEEDLRALHVVRLLSDLAGLVKRRKGIFRGTKEGERLRSAERAGELYARLFRAHFQRLNLAYLDRFGPEAGDFQSTIAFSLLRFSRAGGRWRTATELVNEVVLPKVLERIPPGGGFIDHRRLLMEARFLRPLVSFALAEERGSDDLDLLRGRIPKPARYRKSDLYDRFLGFRL